MEHCVRVAEAGHSVPCAISTVEKMLPEKNATPLAIGNITPGHHPRALRLVTMGLL